MTTESGHSDDDVGMTERIVIDGHRHVLVRADDLLWAVNTLKIENRYGHSEIVQRLDAAIPHGESIMRWDVLTEHLLPEEGGPPLDA